MRSMPFPQIKLLLEPFSRGVSEGPDESHIRKGSRISNMSTCYDGTKRDHLAEHMLYLSTASSFWFSRFTYRND